MLYYAAFCYVIWVFIYLVLIQTAYYLKLPTHERIDVTGFSLIAGAFAPITLPLAVLFFILQRIARFFYSRFIAPREK